MLPVLHQPEDSIAPGGLSERQKLFCKEYICHLNIARAARAVGYTPSTANGWVYRMFEEPEIQAEIKRLMKERADRTLLSADRVVLELATVAFSSQENYIVGEDGKLLLTEGVDPIALQAVATVRRKVRKSSTGEEVETEVRLWDKLAALKLLGQHLGMFTQRVTVQGDLAKPIEVVTKPSVASQLPSDDTILECLKRLGMYTADSV